MLSLRSYQQAAVESIEREWGCGHRRTLLCMATGTGKTVTFAEIARRAAMRGGRTLVLAHRGELLDQAADKITRMTGLACSREQAESSSLGEWNSVTVGSVQTLMQERRLAQFQPDRFSHIIVDEAHHAVSDSYHRVLDYFETAQVLGVTATADRADRRGLSEVFDSLAYEYGIADAIHDGWLCPIEAQMIPLKLDISYVPMQSGDYAAGQLGAALEPYLDAIADEMATICATRKTVVFLPLVQMAKEFADRLNARGMRACEVDGMSQDRAEVLDGFQRGEYNVLCNSMLLCLDEQTEILTARGFVGPDEIRDDDLVANWNFDGSVFFEKPHEIVRRPLGLDEHMTSIESRTINLRVTNTHRMIVGCGANNSKWKKIAADELRNGHLLPTCGIAEPLDVQMPMPPYERLTHKRVESGELYYTHPSDLTLDECRFIGFFLAEGTITQLQSGGIEYKVGQVKDKYPEICEWFDNVVDSCGFSCVRKEHYRTNIERLVRYWSFCRGTGHSVQSRNGLFRIEPYLDHDGSELFWGLNEAQFDALIEGFWYGDGVHGAGKNGMPKSIQIRGCYQKLFNLWCAIGSVRGWRCAMYERPQKNPKHHTQYEMRLIKNQPLNISYKTEIVQEAYFPENVWCVRTTSKNIITRRNGHVVVMGNTEGWDCPDVDCIVCLRPTKSRGLYCLDEKTEVLTRDGWKTDVEVGEEVLAFDKETGETRFVPALAKVRRELEPDEFFCSIKGQSCDIRVTNHHRMLYDNKRHTGWKFKEAQDLAQLKDGAYIPVCGNGKFPGVPLNDAELTFIGWVMTDGCINPLNNQITITQGEQQTEYCKEIEQCIIDCGFKFNRIVRKRTIDETHYNAHGNLVIWTISKGKPRGRDKHLTGWERLEPWLSKDLSTNLFDMTDRQFAVMLEAIYHGDGNKYWKTTYHIGKGNKTFIERLQMMAIQRGYRASVSLEKNNEIRKSDLWILHIKKQNFVKVGSQSGKHSTWEIEPHTDETCWCVQNELGTLVTRRNGKVAIVGNCQMVGRGTRLAEGKDKLLLLDFLWMTGRHDLCRPATLMGASDEVTARLTEMTEEAMEDGGGIDLLAAESQAESDVQAQREEALAKELEAMRHRKAKLVDPLQYALSICDLDLSTYEPEFEFERGAPTEKQIEFLERRGIDASEMTAGMASKMIDTLMRRQDEGMATPKQVRMLERKGFKHPGTWTFEQASKMMSILASNRWQVPMWIDPETYDPKAKAEDANTHITYTTRPEVSMPWDVA